MSQQDYSDESAHFLEAMLDERATLVEDAELPVAPLNNFFNDELLTLLYHNEAPCATLSHVVETLNIVANRKAPRHRRAAAAVDLGRFIQERHRNPDRTRGSSSPKLWFLFARQLNSVIGALELANTYLGDRHLRVELDPDTDPLPQLHRTSAEGVKRRAFSVPLSATQAWYEGARVVLRHRQRGFSDWHEESFRCALECIVNYLTLLPEKQLAQSTEDLVAVRRHALKWIKPLWNALINAVCTLCFSWEETRESYRSALIEQQLAVLAWLDELECNPKATRFNVPPAPDTPGSNEMTIIRGSITPSSDKADDDYLAAFEILRHPMAFRTLGSLEDLRRAQATLQAEFPWATDAIDTVMNEFFARKRHGAQRLGMGPVLLAGKPGTGKTRFSQRLAEVLGTPNLVINLAGMSDVKLLKGVTRGWASHRPSRMVEFIAQTKTPNPLFILDEIDKAGRVSRNGGDPQEALLDLLEPGNARRYQDIYLMTECDLSHCLYIATCNSLMAMPDPLLSRMHPVIFPAPGPEHTEVIVKGIVCDMEASWGLPAGTLALTAVQIGRLRGLSPREMRRATIEMLGSESAANTFLQH